MQKYICRVCGEIYDPAIGDPAKGIAPGTPFAELPLEWLCPTCQASRSEFEKYDEE